jgi:hypothetical protein
MSQTCWRLPCGWRGSSVPNRSMTLMRSQSSTTVTAFLDRLALTSTSFVCVRVGTKRGFISCSPSRIGSTRSIVCLRADRSPNNECPLGALGHTLAVASEKLWALQDLGSGTFSRKDLGSGTFSRKDLGSGTFSRCLDENLGILQFLAWRPSGQKNLNAVRCRARQRTPFGVHEKYYSPNYPKPRPAPRSFEVARLFRQSKTVCSIRSQQPRADYS